MSTYKKLAGLKLQIDSYGLEPLKQEISSGYTRHTTVVRFRGQNGDGRGEDVAYDTDDQLAFQKYGPKLEFSGSYTLESFSRELDKKELFSAPPKQRAYFDYRRWAYESAALDLALKQKGVTLAEILGLTSQPVNFVVSIRLGEPASLEPVKKLLEVYPNLRFKLDPTNDWSDELIKELAALGVVDTLDLKGHYNGTRVDVKTDPELYKKIVNAFPNVWIEDPDVNPETKPILEPHAKRITWDAPIHSIADIEGMPFRPTMTNIKPSRFGKLKTLFDTYDYCKENNIGMYGGGQFELGVGRRQIQYLASLFHPNAPNDVAPCGYNSSEVLPNLPQSPIIVEDF